MRMIKSLFVTAGLFFLAFSAVACNTAPAPVQAGPFFSQTYDLPQTRSPGNLAEYLATEHLEFDLDGWFFFGSLIDSAAPEAPGVFFISMQRIAQNIGGLVWQTVPAIVAYNNATSEGYVFGGDYTLDIDPLVKVTSSPWKVEINSFSQPGPLMSMGLVSGTMGQPGAVYRLTADLPDQLGSTLEAEVMLRDRMGAVNQGYGTSSFFPQYLNVAQLISIVGSFGNSVARYLYGTGDPMHGQGSYYYSLPLMDVESFWIKRDGAVISSGSGGVMWMDHIVQSYGREASDVLIGKAWWEFFSIMLPEENAAIMVITIKSKNGSLPVASLFKSSGERTTNSALKALHSWSMNEIDIEAASGGEVWTSPDTGQSYVQEHRIRLNSSDFPADLTIKMVRTKQEIVVDLTKYGLGKTIKYEGLASVTGTLAGKTVTGTAFVELQPYGHQ